MAVIRAVALKLAGPVSPRRKAWIAWLAWKAYGKHGIHIHSLRVPENIDFDFFED